MKTVNFAKQLRTEILFQQEYAGGKVRNGISPMEITESAQRIAQSKAQ